MNKSCPTIHKHPFFEASFNPEDKIQVYEKNKLEKFLTLGAPAGDRKNYDLLPLYGFPRGNKSIRIFFVNCRDCRKELFLQKCSFCEGSNHTMDDAVLFEIDSNHEKAYKKAKKNLEAIKNPSYKL